MNDYSELIEVLRFCGDNDYSACPECPHFRECGDNAERGIMHVAADAIEELQNYIADICKKVEALTENMQAEADICREAEKYHLNSDQTVSTFTWVHNMKCTYERIVRDLDDLNLPLPEEVVKDG